MQELSAQGGIGHSVDGIADNGQADRREMDADLMRSARLQPYTKQRVLVDQLEQLEVGDGVAWPVRVERLAGRGAPVAGAPNAGSAPAGGGAAAGKS